MANYISTITQAEKQLVVDLLKPDTHIFGDLGTGVSVFDESGTWLGALVYMPSGREVVNTFTTNNQLTETLIPLWPQVAEELFKSQDHFTFTFPNDNPTLFATIDKLGWWEKMPIGNNGLKFTFEKNYTLEFLQNFFANDPNFVQQHSKVRTSVVTTSTGTFITKIHFSDI